MLSLQLTDQHEEISDHLRFYRPHLGFLKLNTDWADFLKIDIFFVNNLDISIFFSLFASDFIVLYAPRFL